MKLNEVIENELEKHNESDNLSKMLSSLSMNGKQDLDALEWSGRCAPGQLAAREEVNDSDDDSDPFKILASHSGTGFHKKRFKYVAHRIIYSCL